MLLANKWKKPKPVSSFAPTIFGQREYHFIKAGRRGEIERKGAWVDGKREREEGER